jgi:hypothetical protein
MIKADDWPQWWQWDLNVTDHVADRMGLRAFSEVDLRGMLEDAIDWEAASPGRFIILTRFQGKPWKVVVEPDEALHQLDVVTAYPADV